MISYHITCIKQDSLCCSKIQPFMDQWVIESYTMSGTNSPNTKSQKTYMENHGWFYISNKVFIQAHPHIFHDVKILNKVYFSKESHKK